MLRFCGNDLPPQMTSTGETMTIVFESDYSVAHDGFSANYLILDASTSELKKTQKQMRQNASEMTNSNFR